MARAAAFDGESGPVRRLAFRRQREMLWRHAPRDTSVDIRPDRRERRVGVGVD